jgi:pimeloyl-ACP methyl ester carboxylesterase
VLVVWGDRAAPFNPAQNATEVVRLAKRGRAVRISGAGLLPHEEKPEAVARDIEAFLQEDATS